MDNRPVAVITGASRGIGAATAERFTEKGYRVALVALEEDELEEVAHRCRNKNGAALCCPGDLADLDFAESVITRAISEFGRIDVLVNNAAWREVVSMRHITPESWEKTVRVSLTAPAFLARWAAAAMERQGGGGVIINVSSVVAKRSTGVSPAYTACKGALNALTCELASLYGPSGIRVVAVSPGAVDTEMSSSLAAAEKQAMRAFSEDMIMLQRWAHADEIARCIVALAGDDASYITGTTINVDGGWSSQQFPVSLRRRAFPSEFA